VRLPEKEQAVCASMKAASGPERLCMPAGRPIRVRFAEDADRGEPLSVDGKKERC